MPRKSKAATLDQQHKDLYRSLLSLADQEIYDHAGDGLDLGREIRLLRTLIARVASQDSENFDPALLRELCTILVRAVYIQHRSAGQVSDLEQSILCAADAALHLED